jgi:hypothetical protein
MKNALLGCQYVPDTQQHGAVLVSPKAEVCLAIASVRYRLANKFFKMFGDFSHPLGCGVLTV